MAQYNLGVIALKRQDFANARKHFKASLRKKDVRALKGLVKGCALQGIQAFAKLLQRGE